MLRPALLLVVAALAAEATAAPLPPHVVFWQPPDSGEPAASVRLAVEREARARGGRVTDVTPPRPRPPSLAPELAAAIAEDRALRFADAARRLDALAQAAEAAGGGDLDAHQLSDLYLHRGLARAELQVPEAWNDFVRAARLDPARVLDPSQFPPRVVATYRRAADEAVAQPRAQVELHPLDARLHIDGQPSATRTSLALGPHLLRAEADGYVPWAGTIEANASRQTLELPLVAAHAPAPAELRATADGGRPIAAVVERAAGRWRLTVRDLTSDEGRVLTAPLPPDDAERVTVGLLRQLLEPLAPAATARAQRRLLPWWAWTLIGTAASAAVVVPIGVVYTRPSASGTAGGPIGPLR